MSLQYGELRPILAAEIVSLVCGTPANFNGFRVFGFVAAASSLNGSQPNCTVFGRLMGWYITYTFSGLLAQLRNFARCKIHFASFKSCAFLFW